MVANGWPGIFPKLVESANGCVVRRQTCILIFLFHRRLDPQAGQPAHVGPKPKRPLQDSTAEQGMHKKHFYSEHGRDTGQSNGPGGMLHLQLARAASNTELSTSFVHCPPGPCCPSSAQRSKFCTLASHSSCVLLSMSFSAALAHSPSCCSNWDIVAEALSGGSWRCILLHSPRQAARQSEM